jgi:hypothetical protein
MAELPGGANSAPKSPDSYPSPWLFGGKFELNQIDPNWRFLILSSAFGAGRHY